MQTIIIDFISKLFVANGILIAVGAYVLGIIIKTSLDFIPNKYIPLISGIFGAVIAVVVPNIFPDSNMVFSAIQGMTLGWAATGGYETIKNLSPLKLDKIATESQVPTTFDPTTFIHQSIDLTPVSDTLDVPVPQVLEAPAVSPVLEAPAVSPVLEAPVVSPVLEAPVEEPQETNLPQTDDNQGGVTQ